MPIELFTVDDGVHGRELWRTDGTATGTFLVKDILPGSVGSDLANFTTVGSQVFFTTSDRQFGPVQLWVTDGTAAGTVKVSATISGAENFVAYNGFLYFNGQTISRAAACSAPTGPPPVPSSSARAPSTSTRPPSRTA